ncbi:MAG: hypothetical protein C4345_02300, partial [Chloroflexota bacterium]
AAVLGLAGSASLHREHVLAQDATPAPIELPRFDGQTLNFMIIQPHKVTGDILKADFEAATGATVNLTTVP